MREALAELEAHYANRGIRLVERGKRWQFQTAPDLAHLLRREREQARKLSRAATEVLAIVAYHEPVSRAEIEAIRGVQTSAGTLDVLMEAGWVRVAGRREVPGRPVIYATTPEFLSHFGLAAARTCPESTSSRPRACSTRSTTPSTSSRRAAEADEPAGTGGNRRGEACAHGESRDASAVPDRWTTRRMELLARPDSEAMGDFGKG